MSRENPADCVHIGSTLIGFCGGLFGRDSYGDKVIEGLGYDWCVAREADSAYGPDFPVFACTPGRNIREVLSDASGPSSGARGRGTWSAR